MLWNVIMRIKNGRSLLRMLRNFNIIGLLGALCVLWLLWIDQSYSPKSTDLKCQVTSDQAICSFITEHCNQYYFAISFRYYCSKFYPSILWETLVVVFLLSLLALCLALLSVLVSNYLFVNLEQLARLLHINNHVLSFVFLPLTNALADIVEYQIGFNAKTTELVLSQLIGSCLIMCTIIIGSISLLKPFSIANFHHLMLDVVWLLAALCLMAYVLADGMIVAPEAAVLCIGYGIYVFYLFWYGADTERESPGTLLNVEESIAIATNRESFEEVHSQHDNLSPRSLDLASTMNHELQTSHTNNQVNRGLQGRFDSVFNVFSNIFICIEKTFMFLIPLPSPNRKSTKKKLSLFHVLARTWYISIVLFLTNLMLLHINWLDVVIPATLSTLALSYLLSPTGRAFNLIINMSGILCSLLILTSISGQILKTLKNIGLVLNLSDYILGLFVFSISNTLSDLITNITITMKVDPTFGINSCLGTPVLLILVGLGGTGLITTLRTKAPVQFELHENMVVSMIILLSVCAFLLIYVPLNGWKFDRKLGIILYTVYFLLFVINLI